MVETKDCEDGFTKCLDLCQSYEYREWLNPVPFLYKKRYSEEWVVILPIGETLKTDSVDAAVMARDRLWEPDQVAIALDYRIRRLLPARRQSPTDASLPACESPLIVPPVR